MEICVITPDRTVAPFLRLTGAAAQGPADRGNELAGVAFNPAGDRMYFSAQRAFDFGVTYEVRGPFAGAGAPPPARLRRRGRRRPPSCGARPTRVTLAQLRRGIAIEVRSTHPGRASPRCAPRSSGGSRGSAARPSARAT